MIIHFIGIGGIGVSALAQYYLHKGCDVSGSDLDSSEITDALSGKGAKLLIGKHKIANLSKSADLVIYSPAVQPDNPELREAKKLDIKCRSYPQALGCLTKRYFTIAVCGSHGKSTTAAMVGIILTRAGFDPTVIVGTRVKEFGESNCRVGKSGYLVIEADEHFASFLNYFPKIVVLTSLEKDHLDYYKNFRNYVLSFEKFVSHLPKDGILVANRDDENVAKIVQSCICPASTYSLRQKESKELKKILKIPGEFNIANALAALSTARELKIPDTISFKALAEYKGSWRRFEEKDLKIKIEGEMKSHLAMRISSSSSPSPRQRRVSVIEHRKLKIIQDYAHHPTQVLATLNAARQKFPEKKIWCIFQPHQYQRTYYLFNDFVDAISKVGIDKMIITDIYDVPGREDKNIKKRVSSRRLADALVKKSFRTVQYVPNELLKNYVRKKLKEIDVLIIMGAGDIYKLPEKLKLI